jgi:hypothetical protein
MRSSERVLKLVARVNSILSPFAIGDVSGFKKLAGWIRTGGGSLLLESWLELGVGTSSGGPGWATSALSK